MILLLGKNEVIEEYVKDVLNMDLDKDVEYYPSIKTHYTELFKHVDDVKKNNPKVIVTQNIEMVDVFLMSDLDFEVVTVRKGEDGKIRNRTLSKNDVYQNREVFAFEPRL